MRAIPALKAAIFFALGIIIAHTFSIPFILQIIILSLGIIISLILFKIQNPMTTQALNSLLILLLITVGAFRYTTTSNIIPANNIGQFCDLPRPVKICGQIIQVPRKINNRTIIVINSQFVDTGVQKIPTSGNIVVTLSVDNNLEYLDKILLTGKLQSPKTQRNPFEFSYKNYLERKDIFATLSITNPHHLKIVEKNTNFTFYGSLILPIKNYILRNIDNTLKGDTNALLKGILLGKRETIPNQIEDYFSDAGVIHVLAVSGLHVGLVMTIFITFSVAFTRWSKKLPYGLPFFITILGVILYALLIGKRPSSIRATIMVVIFLLGIIIERKGFSLNSIGFAALMILMFDPQMLFDVGFQLSFVAVSSIVRLFPWLKSYLPINLFTSRLKQIFFGLILVSVCVLIGTAPIVAFYFGKFTPISIIANVFIVPAMTFIVALGFASATLSLVSVWTARIFAATNWILLKYTIIAAKFFANIPFGHFLVTPPSLAFLGCYYTILFTLPQGKWSLKVRKFLVFFTLIGINVFIWKSAIFSPIQKEISLTFLDVGQGDCIFIEFPYGETMLIDAGETGKGRQVVVPFLQKKGVKYLDYVVCTHPHNDHIGGLPALLENLPVKMILDSGQDYTSYTYKKYLQLIYDKKIPFREVKAGEKIHGIQDVEVLVLNPNEEFLCELGYEPEDFNLNNASVILKVTYGDVSFLLTGDIEKEVEEIIIQKFGQQIDCQILKISHHGSISSSTREFLEAVTPQIAIIQCGTDNKFGHPHNETLEKLDNMECKIYRTDHHGGIIITAGKNRIKSQLTIK